MKERTINLSARLAPCPLCGRPGKRHSPGQRRLREVGISEPTILRVRYSKHYCLACAKHFSMPMDHLAPPTARYTNRVRAVAVDLVQRCGLTLCAASFRMRKKYHVEVPPSTINGWEKERAL